MRVASEINLLPSNHLKIKSKEKNIMASTIGATSKVYKNVLSYFERELKNYEVILVRQKITEDYLYRVIAQNKITGKYAVW